MEKQALASKLEVQPQNRELVGGRIIQDSVRIAATPEMLWSAWTDPMYLSGWFADRASGDGTPGGTINWIFDTLGIEVPMHVAEAIPNRKLVLHPPGGAPLQPKEIVIDPDGNHSVLRFTHSGFPDSAEHDDEYTGVRSDWHVALRILKHYCENCYAAPKRNILVLRKVDADYDTILRHFCDPQLLRTWLSTDGGITDVGERYAMLLQGGGVMTGETLAITEREICITWREINGVLSMKTLTFPGIGRLIALNALAWHMGEARTAEIEAGLHTCIDRLAQAITNYQAK